MSFVIGARLIAERAGWRRIVSGGVLATGLSFAGFVVAALAMQGMQGM